MSYAPARQAGFWVAIARAAIFGALSGAFAVVFLTVEHAAISVIWGDALPIESFSGGWKALVVPIVAGVVVGALYLLTRLPARIPGFMEDLESGRVEPSIASGAVAVSLVSLVGGLSLGPEAPLATGTGGAATWWLERRGASAATIRSGNETAVSGVFGGLLSSPLIGAVLTIELEHRQSLDYTFRSLVPAIVAGVAGFIVVNPVMGDVFLGRYEFDAFELQYWYFGAALGIGIVGAIVAVVIGAVLRLATAWFSKLDQWPILRAVIGGAVVGVLGYALPLTMFSGVDQLETAFENAATIGIALLLVTAFAKIVALSVSLGSGFYGGPFFPIFFIGGVIGAAFHLLVPSFPLALAVGGFMGATAGAAASIPLSIMLFAIFIVGIGPPAAGVIGLATITGFVMIQGFGLAGRSRQVDPEPVD